jgi:ATP-binding cassette, subfamily B, bacterial MsbA
MVNRYPLLMSVNAILLTGMILVDMASIFSLAPAVDYFATPEGAPISKTGRTVINLIARTGLPIGFMTVLVLFFFMNCLRSLVAMISRYYILKIKYAVLKSLIMGTYEDFFNSRWFFFSQNSQGTLINTFTREMEVVGNSFGAIALLFTQSIQTVGLITVALVISWQVTAVSIAAAVLFVLPLFLLGKLSRRLGKLNTSTSNVFTGVLVESISFAKTILGFGNQHKSYGRLSAAFDVHRNASIKSQILNHSQPLIYFPFGIAVIAIAAYIGKRLGIFIADFSVLLLALLRILINIGNMVTGKNALDNFFPSFEQIDGLRRLARDNRQVSGSIDFNGFKRGIVIENLAFSFPDKADILNNLNMQIPKGKMIAIVGESGGGKSTLIDVIMGFNEPTGGCIHIDGTPLALFDIKSYRSRIGYVPQESVLFNMSVRDNLLWAKEDSTQQELETACRLANALEFIKELPAGYDTVVGDRGVRLSGGQVQRIALARAVLRQPEILILDEATSSLDTRSERIIQNAIENIAKETTIIAIAHRLSSIVAADHIYLLERGRVVEEGTYEDLTRLGGKFEKMIALQSVGTDR